MKINFSTKTIAAIISANLLWNSAYAAVAVSQSHVKPLPIDAGEILYSDASLRGELSRGLQNPEVLEALAKQGIQKQEVQLRLAAMSDQELMQVQKGFERQAGGEVVVAIGLTTLIIVALIILLLK